MLEFPECQNYARQINEELKGKIVSKVVVLQSPHSFAFFYGNVEDYPDMLEGLKVTGGCSYGGLVQIELEEYVVVFGDGAYPRYFTDEKKIPKKHQFMLAFDDGSALTACIQMYGGIYAAKDGELDNEYYKTAKNKPQLLSDSFTWEYFKGIRETSSDKLSAKAFLATEQRFPGLGNGVLQDILYHAEIHPKRKMGSVSEAELMKMYESVVRTLTEMRDKHGRDTETDLLGNKGEYVTYLSKNTLWQPCPKCGYEIHKASYMGGAIYFCENCQKQ